MWYIVSIKWLIIAAFSRYHWAGETACTGLQVNIDLWWYCTSLPHRCATLLTAKRSAHGSITAYGHMDSIWLPIKCPRDLTKYKIFHTQFTNTFLALLFYHTQSNMKGRIFNIMPHYCTTAHHSWETPCSHYSWLHCMQFRYHWGESLKHEADKRIPQNWAHYGTTCIMGKRLPQLGLVGSIFLEKWVNEMSSSCSLSHWSTHTDAFST